LISSFWSHIASSFWTFCGFLVLTGMEMGVFMTMSPGALARWAMPEVDKTKWPPWNRLRRAGGGAP
jgi:predicted MFS family arabinose efflux permease